MRRRRDVLMLISASLVGTLVLGVVPALRPLWYLTGVSAIALAAYVGLLVRLRSLSVERELKLSYLPGPAAAEPALLLRRSVN